jgi:hypothetical protein
MELQDISTKIINYEPSKIEILPYKPSINVPLIENGYRFKNSILMLVYSGKLTGEIYISICKCILTTIDVLGNQVEFIFYSPYARKYNNTIIKEIDTHNLRTKDGIACSLYGLELDTDGANMLLSDLVWSNLHRYNSRSKKKITPVLIPKEIYNDTYDGKDHTWVVYSLSDGVATYDISYYIEGVYKGNTDYKTVSKWSLVDNLAPKVMKLYELWQEQHGLLKS